jgi:HD-like signal output (HDOD) protein
LKIRLRRTRGSGGNPSDAVKRRGPILVSDLSLATALAKRQAIQRSTSASEKRNKVFKSSTLTFPMSILALALNENGSEKT